MKHTDDPLLIELKEALIQEKLAFLVGAGISMGRQSQLPSWNALIKEILQAIASEDGKDDVPQVLVHQEQLLNEVLLQLVSRILGRSRTDDLIRQVFTSQYYSPIHKFLWWTIRQFQATIATPNYDELIEAAAKGDPNSSELLREQLVKLHGSVSDLSLARYTIESVYQPLDSSVRKKLVKQINNRVLIVVGYRGADQYDIMPVVFKEAKPEKVVWLVHNELDKQVKTDFLERAKFPVDIKYCSDCDALFQRLYKLVLSFKPVDSDHELDSWQTSGSNYPEWWRSQVRSWSAELWATSPQEMLFLWARILDYVRAYEDVRRNTRPAEVAYQRFLSSGVDLRSLRAIEAKARLAYIRRTTGRGSLEEFQEVLKECKEARHQAPISMDWDRLIGFILHQFGVLLQNRRSWHQAKTLFKDAEAIRKEISDPELHHSVFLQFMNAYEAHRRNGIPLDELAPDKWRSTLIPKLESMASKLHEAHNPEQYGQALHNIAFIHQALAEESWNSGDYDQAKEKWTNALDTYIKAMHIRLSLRDPRMAAQSEVRIAQCKIGLARVFCKKGETASAISMIQEAESLADSVEKRYRSMPQEPLRIGHLENIRKDAAELLQCIQKHE